VGFSAPFQVYHQFLSHDFCPLEFPATVDDIIVVTESPLLLFRTLVDLAGALLSVLFPISLFLQPFAMASTLSTSFSPDSLSTAIIVPGTPTALTVSYKRLAQDVLSFQKQLTQLGISTGEAVSIALPNTYEFIVSFLACGYQRAIAAPLNPAYKQSEFEFYIDDLSSAVVIVPEHSYREDGPAVKAARKHNAAIAECYMKGADVVLDVKEQGKLAQRQSQPLLRARPDDVALVLHTSGTTGRPKAVPLTHRNLTRTMQNIRNTYELSTQDRTMLVMPLFHVHGLLAGFLSPLSAGGSVIVPERFSARSFWADFLEHKANWYSAVPTIHQILLKSPQPNPMPKIRFIRSCSSPLAPTVFHALEASFGAPVLEAYAMTEAAHQMCSNQLPQSGKRKPGSVGIGQGVDVKILDDNGDEVPQGSVGEICVRGENVTKGYLNNDKANKEAFTRQGFFRTGDQGKMDEDGYVTITGRIKELINRGGEKISPIELDHLIAGMPEVSEVVSFAIPSELYGQEVGVAIIPRPGAKVTEQAVVGFVAKNTASFKKPKRVSPLSKPGFSWRLG
jgi:oxalate---CoA ligase